MATFNPDHGWLVCVFAPTPNYYDANYDVTATTNPAWGDWFGATADIGLFSYKLNPGGVVTTPDLAAKTIALPAKGFTFRLQLYNGNYVGDYCNMDLEFLSADGTVLGAIRVRADGNFNQALWYGPNLASLTMSSRLGSNAQTFGNLTFTDNAIVYTTDTGTNRTQSFTIPCTTANITGLRFSNVKSQSNYTGVGSSGAYVLVRITGAPPPFNGDFAALSAVEYAALSPDLLLPSGAAIGHAQGVGLTASGTAPSYVLSRGVRPGETGVLLDASNQVMARLSYLGGIASLTVEGVTTSAPSTAAALYLAVSNGQVFAYDAGGVIVRSERFIRQDRIGSGNRAWIELQPGESLSTIWTQIYPLDAQLTYDYKRQPINPIPANQEPRALFEPQDVAWVGGEGKGYAGPVNANPLDLDLLCAGLDRYWLRDGVQNVLQGYIESTVTINGEGVARRVLCFDQAGNLVGETMSRASDGVYRFDLLWLNRRYMVVAQDDPAYGPADYNAVAADYQAPKPYPPGGGVAPAPFPMLAPLKRK
ncbi:hypothetical protein ACET67_14840 [Aeromonas veronii]